MSILRPLLMQTKNRGSLAGLPGSQRVVCSYKDSYITFSHQEILPFDFQITQLPNSFTSAEMTSRLFLWDEIPNLPAHDPAWAHSRLPASLKSGWLPLCVPNSGWQ